ncbi:DUF1684 domain-containing protein [Flammeovirga sp. SubArs3]|uniref:DUF1684 domain-containing protein n=1 Tax=Flammeovirga sp. SubArs3 TaxID=2995316 RepID=UPI00248B141A|nr:DUF1684 domain-containing protein [Flammeovirga sp. SubArs3]
MKKVVSLLLFLLFNAHCFAQDYYKEIEEYQEELNTEYRTKGETPLSEKDRLAFKEHEFFPIDSTYKVEAKFKRVKGKPFKMKTSSKSKPTYEKYGELTFTLQGKKYKLTVFQSHRLRAMEEYKDYLFLPFMDKTNGFTTYGAGRYLECSIPEGKTIIVDFNKAYNPYCAYSDGYACPIPPKENFLNTEIKAGIKLDQKNKH